jgi:predicted NBD/HSP70 family sugar kinase
MTKQRIAGLLNLSLPSVSRLLEKLIVERLLTVSRGLKEKGPRLVYIGINERQLHALGLHITRHGITGATVDAGGRILKSWSDTVQATEGSSGLLRRILLALVDARKHSAAGILQGVGIGIAGTVRNEAISENFPILPDWRNVNLSEIVQKETGLRTCVANDAFAETFAEKQYGCARGVRNALYFHYGWGLQLGLIIDSEIRRGAAYAGEIGHLQIAESGPVCICGRRGCLESMASIGALSRAAVQATRQGAASEVRTLTGGDLQKVGWDTLRTAADHGDILVGNLLERASDHLAVALAAAINLLDPELLILGGYIRNSPRFFIQNLCRKICLRLTPQIAAHLRFQVSELGPEAGVIGAGSLVFHHLFDAAHESSISAESQPGSVSDAAQR